MVSEMILIIEAWWENNEVLFTWIIAYDFVSSLGPYQSQNLWL
jgi:hypothetical protein